MRGLHLQLAVTLLLSAILFVIFATAAFPVPGISDLTSPTHPDENSWYPDNDPVLEWSYENPSLASAYVYGTGDTTSDVAVSGNHAYVADGPGGLK